MSAEPLPPPEPPSRPRRRWLRAAGLGVALAFGVMLLAVLFAWVRVRASLAQLDGTRTVAGLQATVVVKRDAAGVPTIAGGSREDVARALGFLHAQERFFQMDLMRRSAAGELSELVGPGTLPMDRSVRVHGLRGVARAALDLENADGRRLLQAYTDGVNAGLSALGSVPPEYLLLRVAPAPWKPEDTLLTGLAMFLQLHDEQGRRDSNVGVMTDLLPAPMVPFLSPRGTEWDAPLRGEPMPPVVVPGPEVMDLRGTAPARAASLVGLDEVLFGSNNWVVGGAHTADGKPLVADDMHLGIGVPNTWYRAVMTWPEDGATRRLAGVTLPGTPALVAGSTGRIAWGFTNTEGDWTDLVVLETDPSDPGRYRTPGGWQPFGVRTETIRIKGQPDETLSVRTTIWGPVIDRDHQRRWRALRWTAHAPEAVNMRLLPMESARDLREAFDIAHDSGGPPQNFVAADAGGRIGWTVIGRIPRRLGWDGTTPASFADGSRRWDGWIAPHEYPEILDPPAGRLWTANGRTADGDWLQRLGHGGYEFGARPRQIRDALAGLSRATPQDLLRVQLDDRALLMSRWRELLLTVLSPAVAGADPRRAEMRRFVEDWGGRASADSVGYRLVRAFRGAVAEATLPPLVARCRAADPRFTYPGGFFPQVEAPLWALASTRPAHLLPPPHASWDALFVAAVDKVLKDLPAPLADRTWGERNTLRAQHPLSLAVPALGRVLDLPATPLPGDSHMPRVQSPDAGASERFVVSPGQEEQGLFHMPGGQSGHLLSPFFRAGHEAWERGEPTPFLPGEARHELRLVPAAR